MGVVKEFFLGPSKLPEDTRIDVFLRQRNPHQFNHGRRGVDGLFALISELDREIKRLQTQGPQENLSDPAHRLEPAPNYENLQDDGRPHSGQHLPRRSHRSPRTSGRDDKVALNDLQNRVYELEAANDLQAQTLATARQDLERSKSQHSVDVRELKHQMQAEKAASLTKINDLHEEHRKERARLASTEQTADSQVARINRAYALEKEAMVDKHNANIEKWQHYHQREMLAKDNEWQHTCAQLSKSHATEKSNLETELASVTEELVQEKRTNAENLDRANREYAAEVGGLKQHHDATIDRIRETFEADSIDQRKKYGEHLEQLKKRNQDIKATFEKEISRLKSALLGNERTNQAWTDELLKIKFRNLQQQVSNALSPHHITVDASAMVKIAQNRHVDLDPTEFLRRQGHEPKNCLCVVKTAVWAILIDQFFNERFGLGALGPTDGKDKLLQVFLEWRGLLFGDQDPMEDDPPVEEIFKDDIDAHNLRSAVFQTIVATSDVVENNNSHETALGIAEHSRQLQKQCMDEAEARIFRLLEDVCIPETTSSVRNSSSVRRLVRLTLEIALQFGVNAAELKILNPEAGRILPPGIDFHVEGDRDATTPVALVPEPGLARVERERVVTIVPCNVVLF